MLDEAVRQVPALALMVVALIAFLKHLDRVSARHELMGQHCHQVQREGTAAIREMAKIMGENVNAASETQNLLREVATLLRQMNGKETKG